MSRWFRLYDELLDDPKVQMLPPELFKTWVNLLAVASRNDGTLPAVTQLAFSLRVSPTDMQSRLDDLILAGLLDIRDDGRIEPHNWKIRQWKSDDSAERVRKHRQRKRELKQAGNETCNGGVTVTVTTPETDTEADTETESITHPSEQVAAREDGRTDDPFFVKCKLALNGTTERAIDIVRNADGPYGTKAGAAQWLAELIDDTSADAVIQGVRFVEAKRERREPVFNAKSVIAKTAQTAKANAAEPKPPKTTAKSDAWKLAREIDRQKAREKAQARASA